MIFYFWSYFLIGAAAGANGWTIQRAKVFPSEVPSWAIGSILLPISVLVTTFSSLAVVVTTFIEYGFTWTLATIGELALGAFIIGLMPHALRFLFSLISIPICIIILGAVWGFWFI